MHLRGGKLSDATEPAPGPRRLVVWAIARVPGSTRVLGAGETHARDDLGAGLHGVILQVH
jgi:hypothetical protein